MNCFSLYFADEKLYRVQFEHEHLVEPIVSVRGKTPRGLQATTTFQWTSAVQALAALLIREVIERETVANRNRAASLQGGKGSQAASLDFALGRKPLWLKEMFGTSKKGKSLLTPLFERRNPEQREAGPVVISLRKAGWRDISIEIFLNGRLETSLEKISELFEKLYEEAEDIQPGAEEFQAPSSPFVDYRMLADLLRRGYREELLRSLSSIDIFDGEELKRSVVGFMGNPSLTGRLGKKTEKFTGLLRPLGSSARLGLAVEEFQALQTLKEFGQLTVVAPLVFPGTLALFTYLKHWRGIDFDILNHFPHAVEVSARLAREEFSKLPDFVAMGLGPAATLMNAKVGEEYLPYFMLPRGRMRIVKPRLAGSIRRYYLLNDEPSSPSFLLEHLRRDHGDRAEAAHEELDNTLVRLRAATEDEAAILMFPFDYLALKLTSAIDVEIPKEAIPADYVLFASREVLSNKRLSHALEVLLRDAWLELLLNEQLRNEVIEKIISNERHVRIVMRSAGIFRDLFRTQSSSPKAA